MNKSLVSLALHYLVLWKETISEMRCTIVIQRDMTRLVQQNYKWAYEYYLSVILPTSGAMQYHDVREIS